MVELGVSFQKMKLLEELYWYIIHLLKDGVYPIKKMYIIFAQYALCLISIMTAPWLKSRAAGLFLHMSSLPARGDRNLESAFSILSL